MFIVDLYNNPGREPPPEGRGEPHREKNIGIEHEAPQAKPTAAHAYQRNTLVVKSKNTKITQF
jgi:hypothetical protein